MTIPMWFLIPRWLHIMLRPAYLMEIEDHGEEFKDESQLDDKPWSDDSDSEFEDDN